METRIDYFAAKLEYYGWVIEARGAEIRVRGENERDRFTVTLAGKSEAGPEYVDVTVSHDDIGECAFRSFPNVMGIGFYINGVVDGFRSGGAAGYRLGLFGRQVESDDAYSETSDIN